MKEIRPDWFWEESPLDERWNKMQPIEKLLDTKQGNDDYIVFTALSYDEEKRSLQVRIDQIGDDRWFRNTTFKEGNTYEFQRHFNSNEPPFTNSDPMELWEHVRPEQKEGELILPQILLYFWHKDNRLSMELDW
jgi:hypothetical protein